MRNRRQRPDSSRKIRRTIRSPHRRGYLRPATAHRGRAAAATPEQPPFYAPEDWHEPNDTGSEIRFVTQPAGRGYLHPVTEDEVLDRISQLPPRFTRTISVIQFSRMTRKRRLFPCYGMQWGETVYLYPLEESLVEYYSSPPRPRQQIEARMYGGAWTQEGSLWRLEWSPQSIRDFYLNNVLIHEIGHANDHRNRNFEARERFADWFAIEYGYRSSRSRR